MKKVDKSNDLRRINSTLSDYVNNKYRIDLDSHAGSPVVACGKKDPFVLDDSTGYTGNVYNVVGYTGAGSTEELPEGTYVAAHDMGNGITILLVINRALGRPSQNPSLIPPFMMRHTGIEVNDVAVQHAENDMYSHTIVIGAWLHFTPLVD